jgi:putative molybdopterin biosynthesis protein
MPDLAPLRSYEQLKLVADPRRLAILQHLLAAPATLTQLGAALGEHPAWIRHHLQRLVEAGLVEPAETRRVRGAEEHYYRARAGGFLLQELILPQTSGRPVVVFCGSHDLAVDHLAAELAPHLDVLTLPVGSLNGLANLRLGLGQVSGAHLRDESGEYNTPFVHHLFPDRQMELITLAYRTQGLMLARGNPHGLRGVEDLTRPGIRFINRNPGSGTRLWLDNELKRRGIACTQIQGYEHSVPTHHDTARAIAVGSADASLGLEAAALEHGLDFIPLYQERYDLVFPREAAPGLDILADHVQSGAFRRNVEGMRGYESTQTGRQIHLHS